MTKETDVILRRVIIDYGRWYAYLHLEDANGKVILEEVFKQPFQLAQREVAEEGERLLGCHVPVPTGHGALVLDCKGRGRGGRIGVGDPTMPSYEMTAEEANLYGSTLNVWQALRLLQTWHPLMSYGQRFVGESDPYKQSLVVSEAVEWLATKTDSTVDDGLVKHLADVLRTKEGESLVRFCLALAGVQ
jgi:hypothetical protein